MRAYLREPLEVRMLAVLRAGLELLLLVRPDRIERGGTGVEVVALLHVPVGLLFDGVQEHLLADLAGLVLEDEAVIFAALDAALARDGSVGLAPVQEVDLPFAVCLRQVTALGGGIRR